MPAAADEYKRLLELHAQAAEAERLARSRLDRCELRAAGHRVRQRALDAWREAVSLTRSTARKIGRRNQQRAAAMRRVL